MISDLFGGNGGARPTSLNIPRVGVVITDGRSGDDVQGPSNSARAESITMFAIGVGGFDRDELNEIANDPDSMFVFEADNFNAISNIRNLVQTATCNGKGRELIIRLQLWPHNLRPATSYGLLSLLLL